MSISVKIKTNSGREKVEKISDSEYLLWVKAPPQNGRANKAALALLSDFLDVPKTRLVIIRGHKSRNKTITII